MRKTLSRRRLFEIDRKVELKLRLAAKEAEGVKPPKPPRKVVAYKPTIEDVSRLIECMRSL